MTGEGTQHTKRDILTKLAGGEREYGPKKRYKSQLVN